MKEYDYLIVGTGLFGSVFAYMAKQNGYKCLIIDKRDHIGGNCYCKNIDGINVHTYGPHIFHTSNDEIWKFVNNFVQFNSFANSPLAYCGDDKRLYHLPFNMTTFHEIWNDVITPEEAKMRIESQKMQKSAPKNLEEQTISMVGKTIYEKLVKGYTEKQWGKDCKELSPDIIKRLPLRFSYNNNYFNDKYQGIPIGGYNKLFESLLKGIEVKTDCDYFSDREYFNSIADKIVFTGCIDEYYDFCFGKLDYRSLRWDTEILNIPSYQGTAVINYTTKEVDFTRIIEHKYFECLTENEVNKTNFTIVSKEYPQIYNGECIPFYPINNEKNNTAYEKYKELSLKEENVIFGGRLTEYKYYDMSPTIERALSYFKK